MIRLFAGRPGDLVARCWRGGFSRFFLIRDALCWRRGASEGPSTRIHRSQNVGEVEVIRAVTPPSTASARCYGHPVAAAGERPPPSFGEQPAAPFNHTLGGRRRAHPDRRRA